MADLRRLMKERNAAKRITHPYARYSSSGQLTCSLCSLSVKSEVLWPSHLTSKVHRSSVRREKDDNQRIIDESLRKRPAADDEDGGDGDNLVGMDGHSNGQKRVRFTEADDEQQEEASASESFLPADFFGNSSKPPSFPIDTDTEDHESKTNEAPADGPIDEEWAAFEATLAENISDTGTSTSIAPGFSSSATISAPEILYKNGNEEEGEDNEVARNANYEYEDEEDDEAPKETDQEKRDREEKEELMERIDL